MRVSIEFINNDDIYWLPDKRFKGETVLGVHFPGGGFVVIDFSEGKRKSIAFPAHRISAVSIWREE